MSDAFDAITDVTDVVTQPLGLSKSDSEKAAQRYEESLRNLQVPEITSPDLEKLYQVGNYEEIAKRLQLPPSELEKISTDPRLREAQFNALAKLQQVGQEGLTAEDRQVIDQIARQENVRERGAREAIRENAQRRGIGGSGLELISSLANQQGSAQRRSAADLDVAALSRKRALDAVRQAAILGGDIRRQEFGEQSQIASAKDAINQFNMNSQLKAALAQQEEAQRIAEANTAQSNFITRERAMDIPQINYQNRLRQLGLLRDAELARAGAADARRGTAFGTVGTFFDPANLSGIFPGPKGAIGEGINSGVKDVISAVPGALL